MRPVRMRPVTAVQALREQACRSAKVDTSDPRGNAESTVDMLENSHAPKSETRLSLTLFRPRLRRSRSRSRSRTCHW